MESKLTGFGTHHAAYSGPFLFIIFLSVTPQLTKGARTIDQALHVVVHVPFWGGCRRNRNITTTTAWREARAMYTKITGYAGICPK